MAKLPRIKLLLCTAAVAVTVLALTEVVLPPAGATNSTASYDALRTGWDPNEPGLAPSNVSASDFGQLFATQLDGQIYAQPIISNGVVMAITENDKAYGLDPVTGAIKWTRDVGPFWPASAIGCGDLAPNVGATATPVLDPSTGTVYFTAKVNDGATVDTPHWYLHAVSITTGVERAGFPTAIGGAPSNDPAHVFNPKTAMQRPGLLLMNGVVYAGFASHCDYGPYVGYIAGVNASTGKQTTLWSTEAGSAKSEAGIWQSGGGLVSDGPGRIIFATGNGLSPAPGPGKTPPANLAESVVRVNVNPDGTLTAKDFFSPVNNSNLDTDDQDLGSGGPLAIPDGYSTAAHPHLLVQVGKDGRVFLLDRDNLGGTGQGPGGTDAVLQTGGPFHGVWGHPAFWGGDGGYVYEVDNQGHLRGLKIGVDGSGLPSLTQTGSSSVRFGYTSGSPVVTSSGTTSGSALIWVENSSGATGAGAQLQAYDAIPVNGVMVQRYAVPIGTGSKFSVPGTDGGRVYVGNRDGLLYGFGRPTTVALSGNPTDFGSVAVGATATKTVKVTATKTVTVTAVTAAAPFKVGAVTVPKTLTTGQTISVPVTFTPTAAGAVSGSLSFATSSGPLSFDLHGSGTQPGLGASPPSIAFGDVPTTGKVTLSIEIGNTGTTNETITGTTAPSAPFSTTGLPRVGVVLAPGATVSVPITFSPTVAGKFSSSLVIKSADGRVSVPLTGNGVSGAPHLSITPMSTNFGTVTVGQSLTKTVQIANTGNLVLTITKAAPPAGSFGTTTPISEGQQLQPGEAIQQAITFTPTTVGSASGTYLITGNDGQGAQAINFTGIGGAAGGATLPAIAAPAWTYNGKAVQTGGDTVLTPTKLNAVGSVLYSKPISPTHLHVHFTAQIGGGTGGDGTTFEILDAAKVTSTALGKFGGALGYGSLPGIAVTLDTAQNPGDPSANFIGIANGATGTNFDRLTYVATQPAATALKSGTHTVDITTNAAGLLTVSLDDGPTLTATVALPPSAIVGFSAAEGGATDTHTVRSVTISTTPSAPAAGPIVGITSKCVDDLGGGTANGNPVQLYTCNASKAQIWTVSTDNTLQAVGKCMTARGSATAVSTPVQLYTCTGAPGQFWVAQSNGSLKNPNSGLCLEAPAGVTADSTHLELFTCNGGTNQKWKLPS